MTATDKCARIDTVWVDSNTAIASWLASMSKSELIDECFFWHDVALEHGRMHNAVKGENAKLRELCHDLRKEYAYLRARPRRFYVQHEARMAAIDDRIRDLGIEVGDA